MSFPPRHGYYYETSRKIFFNASKSGLPNPVTASQPSVALYAIYNVPESTVGGVQDGIDKADCALALVQALVIDE